MILHLDKNNWAINQFDRNVKSKQTKKRKFVFVHFVSNTISIVDDDGGPNDKNDCVETPSQKNMHI